MEQVTRYAWFPGCWVSNRMPYIEAADRKVLETFGIELAEMKGAQCCPEPYAVLGLGRDTWFALAGTKPHNSTRNETRRPHTLPRMLQHSKNSPV